MIHLKPLTRVAAVPNSPLQVKLDHALALVDRTITFIFQKQHGAL